MGAYKKTLTFGPLEIVIGEREIKYNTPRQKGIIYATGIRGIEIKNGTFFSLGYLTISTNDAEYKIEFPKKFNKELQQWKQDFESGKYKPKEKTVSLGEKPTANINKYGMTTKGRNDIACVRFIVKGKNPKTGRVKTVTVLGAENEPAETVVKRSGLLEPYEVEEQEERIPTERQFEYARNIGVKFPDDATCTDAAILLTRAENGEEIIQRKIPRELIEIAIYKLNLYIPRYAGANDFGWIYYNSLNGTERYEYFAMKVFCENTGKPYDFPHEATEDEKRMFSDFAEKYQNDRSFIESFSRYSIDDMPIGGTIKKKLKAYDIARAYMNL